MISYTEIRIGNLIKWNDDKGADCFYRVHDIRHDNNFGAECISSEFAWFPDIWTISYDEAEGIPLTPEILIACGFGIKDFIEFGDVGFIIIEKEKCILQLETYGELVRTDLPHIKYLHRLQNLYYSLTFKELEIKF